MRLNQLLIFLCVFIITAQSFAQRSPRTVSDLFSRDARTMPRDPLTYSIRNSKTGTIDTFNVWDNIQGKRYLFDQWVKGSVVETDGSIIESDSLLFNFDKELGTLIVTTNKIDVMKFEIITLSSFTLQDDKGVYVFERPTEIDRSKFFQVLVKDASKYRLYKSPNIKFEEANYYNNGITETGKKYDEYIDKPVYYVVFPDGREKEITLKSKTIKSVLDSEDAKVNAYFKQHSKDDVNETFLKGLIAYLNQ